jgi:hypothetical protein
MRILALAMAAAALAVSLPAARAQIQLPSQQQPSGTPSPPRSGVQPGPQPNAAPQLWGAIGFTADGSYSSAWKYASKAEAEAYVATNCARFGRGACEIVSFPGELCVGLASFRGGRWKLAFTGGGRTSSEAQQVALDRCNSDKRTRRRCQLRTVVCGDGR